MSAYYEKLKDPRWQKRRLEVLNRDNFTCLVCENKEATLHVHHLTYTGTDPWDEPLENLETLCEGCHEWREEFNQVMGRSIVPTRLCYAFMRFNVTIAKRHDLDRIADWAEKFREFWRPIKAHADTRQSIQAIPAEPQPSAEP